VLGAIREFLYGWQFIHLTVLIVAWLGGGSWLLMRSLRKHDSSIRTKFTKCLGTALLAGVAGGITGGAIFYMINAIGGQIQVDLRVLGMIIAALTVIAGAFVTFYAMLNRPVKATLKVVGSPMLAIVIIGSVVVGDATMRAVKARRAFLKRMQCQATLSYIRSGLIAYERDVGNPPERLEVLFEEQFVDEGYLGCPANSSDRVGYFYIPARIRIADGESDKIVVCDFGRNHKIGRNALLTDGRAIWYSNEEFSALLAKEENASFAEALAAAESP